MEEQPIAIGFIIEKLNDWLDNGIKEVTLSDIITIFSELEQP
jgi:hypothetical protein